MTFEGTNRVKETKMNILLINYELFKMKSDETVTQMFIELIETMNGLANQGKIFTNAEKVN